MGQQLDCRIFRRIPLSDAIPTDNITGRLTPPEIASNVKEFRFIQVRIYGILTMSFRAVLSL
jgi:hypothetical protein